MTARSEILAAVRSAKPTQVALPSMALSLAPVSVDLVARFIGASVACGCEVVEGRRDSDEADGAFVCEAALGVAENGAVWLTTPLARDELFLAEHVVVVLSRTAVVRDFHEAYERIDVGSTSFGVFMAGPSKTADIEQALVIGAHGPRRVTVLLVD